MNHDWQPIADALRREVGEYGGLLSLFEQQQRFLFARDPESVLRISNEIHEHVADLHDARRSREELVADLAVSCGQPGDSTLRSLLEFLSPEARPLIDALIGEVNVLIRRVRQVSRHNQSLLQHALDSQQQILRAFRPDSFVQTYSPKGRVGHLAVPVASLHVAG